MSSFTFNHHQSKTRQGEEKIFVRLKSQSKSFLTSLLQDTREKNEAFGSSLLLANSPMSPKVVNGSFAAIVDVDEFLAKAYAGIRIAVSSALSACEHHVVRPVLRPAGI